MDSLLKARMLFDKWKTDLINKAASEKKFDNLVNNFIELFAAFKIAEISAEDAYGYVNLAAKAHYPPDDIAKRTYSRSTVSKRLTYTSFLTIWKQGIDSAASESYYQAYPLIDEVALESEKDKIKQNVKQEPDSEDYEVERMLSMGKLMTNKMFLDIMKDNERIRGEEDKDV